MRNAHGCPLPDQGEVGICEQHISGGFKNRSVKDLSTRAAALEGFATKFILALGLGKLKAASRDLDEISVTFSSVCTQIRLILYTPVCVCRDKN